MNTRSWASRRTASLASVDAMSRSSSSGMTAPSRSTCATSGTAAGRGANYQVKDGIAVRRTAVARCAGATCSGLRAIRRATAGRSPARHRAFGAGHLRGTPSSISCKPCSRRYGADDRRAGGRLRLQLGGQRQGPSNDRRSRSVYVQSAAGDAGGAIGAAFATWHRLGGAPPSATS